MGFRMMDTDLWAYAPIEPSDAYCIIFYLLCFWGHLKVHVTILKYIYHINSQENTKEVSIENWKKIAHIQSIPTSDWWDIFQWDLELTRGIGNR